MPFLFTSNQREKYARKLMEDNRRNKAPNLLLELVKNTNLDTNTINDVLESYVKEGKTALPNMMPEGMQGPLEADQRRETPTNSVRPPAYVYNENTNVFNRAPEGVSDPIRQIREVNRFRSSEYPAWTYGEDGKIVPLEGYNRGGYVPPPRKPQQERGAPPRPTAAQEKERLAIEAAVAQLRTKKAVKRMGTTQYEEPIATRDQALSVPVGLGLDPNRYPDIQELVQGYPETMPEEPKQPSFFENLGAGLRDLGAGTGRAIGNFGSAAVAATKNMAGSKDGQKTESVRPAQQAEPRMSAEEYLKSINAKITPANIAWAKKKLGQK